MNILKNSFVLLLAVSLFSCKKEDSLPDVNNIPGLGGDTWAKGPIDNWVYDSLTVPFNIAVKYKWDQFELTLNKTLVPPDEANIIPILSAVKKVWIDSYVAEKDSLFIKKYAPKFFVLCGSASWNNDGTITLGTAEGGKKVVLYVVNSFKTKNMPGYVPADSAQIIQQFHTIQHEFGHILHQTVMYPLDYKKISVGLYTTNWNNVSDMQALQDGFITPYSMSNPDDDFVDMIATMLVEGKAQFDKKVNSITGVSPNGTTADVAKANLRKKEAMVVEYFRTVWGINFYSLQARSRAAVESLLY